MVWRGIGNRHGGGHRLAVASLCWLWVTPAVAAPTEAELEQAFQAVLADPGNMDLTADYARIAADLGDFEAAVSSLERMLIVDPTLLSVQVELGILYFRLGSYAAAEGQLAAVLARADLPPEVRARLEPFLAEARRQTARHRIAAVVSGGLRYQTNANLAPGNTILSFGNPTALPSEFSEDDDFSAFASGRVRYRYDFAGAAGDHLEANLSGFVSRQFEVSGFDYSFAELEVGPRLHLAGVNGPSLRPFVRGGLLFLDDRYYQGQIGGGGRLEVPLGAAWALGLQATLDYGAYESSADRPRAEELDGQTWDGGADLTYRFGESGVTLSGGVKGVLSRADFESYWEGRVGVYSWIDVAAPIDLAGDVRPWTLSLEVQGFARNYDAPDPTVSPRTRQEDELRADAQIFAPITTAAGVFVGIGWQQLDANIPNYTYDNFTALGGFSVRF
jgi:tetratricopeptide (TPR) repeat protein